MNIGAPVRERTIIPVKEPMSEPEPALIPMPPLPVKEPEPVRT